MSNPHSSRSAHHDHHGPDAANGDAQVVTITLGEYRALMEDRAELARLRGVAGGPLCLTQAHFRHDRELVAFLNEHATSATIDWLTAEARRRFGPDRAPSKTSIWRYIRVVREYLSQPQRPPAGTKGGA